MTSKLTRERLQEIAEDGFLKHGESKELARMALVAMDSEPVKRVNADQMHHVCLEANRHLDKYGAMAKEVNKLLGRIPAQPAPVVSAELLHTAASAIEDLLTTKDRTGACMWFDLPFRLRSAANAQPAPVVPDDVLAALQKVARIRLDLNDFDGDRRGIADCLGDAEEALIEVVNRRAAMLQAGNSPIIGIDLASGPDRTVEVRYVAPPGYVMVPKEPTDEMIAAAMNCEDVLFNSDDSFCIQFVNIYEAMLAAAPKEVK
ncbi:hypothetical protein ABLU61_13270 [Klebsiella sp. GG_Kp153]|uniref:hypothetical protein n=1 Tax=Klebsiella TaxID=570 RepID=UPI0009BA458C|nr:MULTISPECIES: hypothetical protein [Klebsiella]HBQ4464770.1 hypothetical protein [Klebsiella pneumoniae subsp. pneumoniae]MEA4649276.1 hypothetical protein [Klebsiella pneumoniae]MEA4756978.1 hypothetical protein [Klebsiella pneumoniae]MEC4352779.1 hypothetical protein [Klebsiella pneumoniae]PLK60288.1 hypothetical protein CWN69_13295 [Klebsiella quasipneumoniae]